MKWRKNILKICAFLIICTITGFITASIISKPIALTDEEISYYTNTAEKVWYEGLDSLEVDDTIRIEYNLKENEVKILPIDTCKQSITVIFFDPGKLITVNNTVVSFWGCFGFYGLFFGSIIYGAIYGVIIFLIFIVKKRKKSRR